MSLVNRLSPKFEKALKFISAHDLPKYLGNFAMDLPTAGPDAKNYWKRKVEMIIRLCGY